MKIYVVFLSLVMVLCAMPSIVCAKGIHPLDVSNDVKSTLTRYSLRAYKNSDPTNVVQGLLFTPKSHGNKALPMIVYIPGKGEIGDVSRHFNQRAIFKRVISAKFQEKYPCFLLALTPPENAMTILGGMPDRPTCLQMALRDFVFDLCKMQKQPKVDLNRLYLTGFSYGGVGAYALAQHFPNEFAAVVPISALPPLPEYFNHQFPGNWWHFHNEGNYNSGGVDVQDIEAFAKLVNDAGGDFRIGTFPALGHDAWTKAWREDVVWEWMFSKTLKGRLKPVTNRGVRGESIPISLSSAVCSASVLGISNSHGPERVADGLEATWYESQKPFKKNDWWQVDLIKPIRGRFTVVSGDVYGRRILKSGYIEASVDGKRWMRMASFSRRSGICTFFSHKRLRFLRVRSTDDDSKVICLRLLKVISG